MCRPLHVHQTELTDQPGSVVMAIGTACWWHDHPAALSGHEVTDVVVGELVARRFGRCDVVPRTTDNNLGSGLLASLQLLRRTIEL